MFDLDIQQQLKVKQLGLVEYTDIWLKMQQFTKQRQVDTVDEIWCLEHYPVFTLGQAGKLEHILANSNNIPVVNSDRGGQVTYHGPGQLICYVLCDLRRKKLSVKQLTVTLQQTVLDLLYMYAISANYQTGAPGVYVKDKKICSIGLRISKGCSYHGISLNIDMDLRPFQQINPCGYPGLEMTQIVDLIAVDKQANLFKVITQQLLAKLMKNLNYE